MTDRRLLRHLVVAVLIKLAVLVLLWCLVVRDARVAVDGDSVLRHSTPTATPTPGAPA